MSTEEKKCSICLKLFDDPRRMPCKHIYCFKCIPHLHRRDLDTQQQIVLQCRICAIRHRFRDWSTLKYYATLHCVPYLTALQFDETATAVSKSSCPTCFRLIGGDSKRDRFEYCIHCDKTICHECLIDHRMQLKKDILHSMEQCSLFRRKNQQNAQQIMNKLANLKIHVDLCGCEFIDQVCHVHKSILLSLYLIDRHILSLNAYPDRWTKVRYNYCSDTLIFIS